MKRKILYVCPSTGIGGVETFIKQTYVYCDSTQFENHYLLFRSGSVSNFLLEQGARVTLLANSPQLFSWKDHHIVNQHIRELINKNKIDLVHSLGAKGALFSATASKQMNVPHVWFQYYPSGTLDRLAALTPHNGLVVTSHYAAQKQRDVERSVRWLITRKLPIEKILLGTDLKPLEPARVNAERAKILATLGIDDENNLCLISMLGQIHPRKGIEVLLEALQELKERHPVLNFRALIFGDAKGQEKYQRKLQKWIDQHQLPAHFMGLSANVALSHSICDMYVNSCVQPEAFSHSLIEAMATGTPPVVPDSGALQEVIHNGENGLIFSTGNPSSLANRLRSLIQEKSLREKLATKAQETVSFRHDCAKTMKHLEQFYQKIFDL